MMIGKKLDWCLTGLISFFVVIVIGSSVQAQIEKIELSIEEVTDQKTPYLNYPVSVIVQEESGLVLISDWANDRLVITDQNGKTQKIIPGLEGPVGIVYDSPTNRLYLTEQKANRIRILDGSTFAPISELKIQGITLNEPRGLWMDNGRKIGTGDYYDFLLLRNLVDYLTNDLNSFQGLVQKRNRTYFKRKGDKML
jgi:DNA-binding beta-propeller fold protein YncE